MNNTVHDGQELGDSTRSEPTCKPSDKHRNFNCVRRTVVGTLAFILSGLLILLTTSFFYGGKKVNFVSYNMQLMQSTYSFAHVIMSCMHNARY